MDDAYGAAAADEKISFLTLSIKRFPVYSTENLFLTHHWQIT